MQRYPWEQGVCAQALYEAGRLDLPDEDEEREMYYETERRMEAHGYHRYEISNYARLGCECRHNVRYWKRFLERNISPSASVLVHYFTRRKRLVA